VSELPVAPQNLDAEESVLGAILLAGASGTSARVLAAIRATGLDAADFYRATHAKVYDAALALDVRGEPADAILVAAELERRSELEEIGGRARLGELAATAAVTSNAPHFARLIRARAVDLAVLRELEPLVDQARNGGLDPADARVALERAVATLAEAQTTEADRRLVPGDEFVLDLPTEIPAAWGGASGTVAWALGEPLMLCGPDGVGKTTLGQQLALGRAGLRRRVLGMRVADDERPVLYLALDRPAQAARSLARMVSASDRDRLRERLVVWRGPVPFNVVKTPRALADFATAQGAGTVVIDSLKDLAPKLSDDEVGGTVNSAIQELVARSVEVLALHHQRKAQQGAPPPKKLADVYGSRWLTAGMGSVFMLWGEAGDPVVELLHLKQPSEPLPACKLLHDHDAGKTAILESVDLLALVTAAAETGLTAEAAAAVIFDEPTPDRNAIEKARRRLEKLVAGGFITKRGERPHPVSYHRGEAS
jgi:replicative DNA helicase